ncbi:unnamed protein product [Plutella xylostella]|uniref:(diamondback moth) hypothetical protein n=1 Tax=Plutella xylostella TaxID=51655 RepID=A0A8S4G882_PLUXY|nr:unnamed protein product [Plutella xylostella]
MATYQCACTCQADSKQSRQTANLPLICMVPRDGRTPGQKRPEKPERSSRLASSDSFHFLDEATIKKHFKLPPRALYLDPFKRPLITFPINEDDIPNFSMDRKAKINQMILDGLLPASAAISAPSVFPYPTSAELKKKKEDVDEELVYILQLPDWETRCPVHGDVIKTPRFIWHSCKKEDKEKKLQSNIGGGPLNRPKPWILSRITDFDLQSQW